MLWPILTVLLRILIGAIFILSGGQKLLSHYQNFLYVIQSYQMIGPPGDTWVAQGMPWMEFILGLTTGLGLWTRVSLVGLWLLSTTFLVVLGQALIRRLPIESCGCFGGMFSVPPGVMFIIDCCIWASLLFLILRIDWTKTFSLDRFFEEKN